MSEIEGYLLGFSLYLLSWITFLFCFRWLWKLVGMSTLVILSSSLALWMSSCLSAEIVESLPEMYKQMIAIQLSKSLCLGVPLALAFECFPFAGRLSDISRGTQFAEQALGGVASRISLLEGLAEMSILLIFFSLGGFQSALPHIVELFEIQQASLVNFEPAWFDFVIKVSSNSFLVGLVLALPVMGACMLVDLCVVMGSRSMGKVNLNFEFMGLKAVCGIIVAFVVLASSPEYLENYFEEVLFIALRP